MHNPFQIIDQRLSNIESMLSNLSLPKPAETHFPEDLLTRKEASEILGISLVTLNSWTKEGRVPAYRIGTRVRYKRAEVLSALKKVQSVPSSN